MPILDVEKAATVLSLAYEENELSMEVVKAAEAEVVVARAAAVMFASAF